ncbi:MAG: hypothetical protein JXB42_10315 [Deltaproteobacteria bacterium]|nr:hypothetical protein [Deltaproteobacteria bacterium]
MSKTYQIPRLAVIDEVEIALGSALTRVHGYDVDVRITGNGTLDLRMVGYKGTREGCTISRIYPETLSKRTVRFLRRRLARSLNERAVLEEFFTLAPLQCRVYEGEIYKTPIPGKELYVDITHYDPYFGIKSSASAVCKFIEQPLSERGRYRLGDILMFYVLRVRAELINGYPRLEIYASRSSKSLVDKLIKKYMADKTGRPANGDIKCIKRVAGAYSRVVSTVQIDKETLDRVSKEVNETIRVELINV